LRGENIVQEFQSIVLDYVQTNYGAAGVSSGKPLAGEAV
jgi:(E)-4-hydroxy-3-methylbut-2-enyl-diphosphate synthase